MHDPARSLRIRCSIATSFILVGLLVSLDARALTPNKSINQYVHDVWQMKDGLPQNSVNWIAQTPDGYIWLATEEGLARFDGARFTVFDQSNSKLGHNFITALMVGRDGSLWICTGGGGLTRFHGDWTTYTTRDGLVSDYVATVFEDRQGSIWIGTLDGLNKLQGGRLTRYGTRDGLPSEPIVAIDDDSEGSLWFGSRGGGLVRLRNGKFATFTRRDGLPNDTVRAICNDQEGNLWIGTDAGGLTNWKGGRFTTEPSEPGRSKAVAFSIVSDREGSLWVGTKENGVRRRRHSRWETYKTGDGLSDDSVRSLLEDREGNTWIGTLNGGINRLADGKFTTFGKGEGLSDNSALSILEDREGRIWIGTDKGGLNGLENGRITAYKKGSGLPDDSVSSVWEDQAGILWVGTAKGLICLEGGRFTHCGIKNGFRADQLMSISGDRMGNVWIGSFHNGLYRLRDGQVTVYGKNEGLTSNYIVSLLEDHEGTLWVGTGDGGLNRFENGRFVPDSRTNVLAHSLIEALYEDREGNLWIGMGGGGLGRLRANRLTIYRKRDGLFDDTVFQVLEDDEGHLWMGSNRGISRVRKRDFDDFDAGKIPSIPHVAYGHADGMRNTECNGVGQPSGWKTRDGRLWFATEGGVAVINPKDAPPNTVSPPVSIEEVLADDKLVDHKQWARLPPDARRLEIHYAGLSFVDPSKVRFRYRLEGFDRGWVEAGTRRVAYYTNLPPGNHRFQVIACNNDGVWNKAGASWSFEILPKYYETWQFAVMMVMILVAGAWGLHRLHVKQVKTQFAAVLAERGRLAREIHDTLAQGFAGISIHLESVVETLEGAPATARQHLDQARGLVRTSLAEARRSVSDLRALALERGNVVEALRILAEQLTAGTGVATGVEVVGQLRDLPPAVEHNLLRIGQEALTNAIKHGRARTITAELAFDPNRVRLSVRDDGCGFDSKEIFTGAGGHFGLLGMRERITQLAGELIVDSTPGQGTEIVVLLPVA